MKRIIVQRIGFILLSWLCPTVTSEIKAQDRVVEVVNKTPKYLFSLGSGITYSMGSVEGKQQIDYNFGSIRVTPKWSTVWPASASETGLSSFENFIRRVSLMAGVEKMISEKISIATGFEAGGRYFMIEEDIAISYKVTVKTNRNYSVYSIPFLLKYNPQWIPSLHLRLIGGVQGNLSRSGTRNGYYEVKNAYAVYPTLSLGFETGVLTKRGTPLIAFEAIWQQGFYNILDENIKIITPYLVAESVEIPKREYQIESSGSHLRVGVKLYFDKNTFARRNSKSRSYPALPSGNLQYINQAELSIKQTTIQVCVIDKQGFDGYQFKVLLNGTVIHENLTLQTNEKCVELPLEPGSVNYISFQPLNKSDSGENVISLKIRQPESTNTYMMRYSPDFTETLRIIVLD